MHEYEEELKECSEKLIVVVGRILVAGEFSEQSIEESKKHIEDNYKKHLKTDHAKKYYAPVLGYTEHNLYIGWKDLQAK